MEKEKQANPRWERMKTFVKDSSNQKIAMGTLLYGVGVGAFVGIGSNPRESFFKFGLFLLGEAMTISGVLIANEGIQTKE